MRVFPILSAVVASLVIYAFVMERDAVRALVGGEPRPAAAAAGPEAPQAAESPADAAPATAVVAMRSAARPIGTAVVLRGRTEASRRVEVRAETSGLVVSEPLPRGASVAAGAVLCRLDPGSRPAALAEAEARLLEAEANERASAALAERGFGAETAAIANRAALQAAQAVVEQARLELARLEVRAPFAGVLEEATAELGALLQPGDACGAIIALDPIELVGYVPETVVGAVEPGAPAHARLQTGERVEARVAFVARSADPETRTFRVEATAANPGGAIRDGITAEIRIDAEGAVGHLVPPSALTLDDAGRLGVRAVVDGLARFMPVQTIRDDAAGFWLGGLPEAVEIIVVGQDFVVDGDPVDVTYREPAP
jgi:multidrug efflux system membrane fusion protein